MLLRLSDNPFAQKGAKGRRIVGHDAIEGGLDRVRPATLKFLPLGTEAEGLPSPSLLPPPHAELPGRRFVDGIAAEDDSVGLTRGLYAHDPVAYVFQHPFRFPIKRVSVPPTPLRGEPQHVAGLNLQDIQFAQFPFARGAGVQDSPPRGAGEAANPPPRTETIAFHCPGGDHRIRRENPQFQFDPRPPAPPSPAAAVGPQRIALYEQTRHLSLDHFGRNVAQEPAQDVDTIDTVLHRPAARPPTAGLHDDDLPPPA